MRLPAKSEIKWAFRILPNGIKIDYFEDAKKINFA